MPLRPQFLLPGTVAKLALLVTHSFGCDPFVEPNVAAVAAVGLVLRQTPHLVVLPCPKLSTVTCDSFLSGLARWLVPQIVVVFVQSVQPFAIDGRRSALLFFVNRGQEPIAYEQVETPIAVEIGHAEGVVIVRLVADCTAIWGRLRTRHEHAWPFELGLTRLADVAIPDDVVT